MKAAALLTLFIATAALADSPFQEGTESVALTHEERALFLEYADTSKARLEKALDQAKGKRFEDQNTIYLAAIRSTVVDSRRLRPGTELLLRVALNQALELSFGIPGGARGVLASSANREVLTVLLEDSIQLAIRYYHEDRAAIESGALHDLPFLRFGAERLELAREWLSAITETDLLVQAQLAVLRHWLYAAAHASQKRRIEHAEELILVDRVLKEADSDPGKRNPADLRRQLRLLHERTRAKLTKAGTPPAARDSLLRPTPEAPEPDPAPHSAPTTWDGVALREPFGGDELLQGKAMAYRGWGDATTQGLSFEVALTGVHSPHFRDFREKGEGLERGQEWDFTFGLRSESKPGDDNIQKLMVEMTLYRGKLQWADKDLRTVKTLHGAKLGTIVRVDEVTGVNLTGMHFGFFPYAVNVLHDENWNYGGAVDVINVVSGSEGSIQGKKLENTKEFWHGKVAAWVKRRLGRVGALSNRVEADWLTDGLTDGTYFVQFTNDLALERIARLPLGVNARYTQIYTRTAKEAAYKQLLLGMRVDF